MVDMKKVSVVVSTYPPYRGGMGNAAKHQAELLNAAGFEVEVITPGITDEEKVVDSVKVRHIKPLMSYGNGAILPTINSLCKGSDVIFLHYPFFPTADLIFARKHQKLVLYYHMDVVGAGWMKLLFWMHRLFILPIIMKRAEKILMSSQSYFETSYIKKFGDKVKIVPFSVDVPDVELEASTEPKALFVGGLDSAHYFKGLNNLLLAWPQVIKEIPAAKLDIVGDGNLRKAYEKQAKDLGVEDSVIFHGSVPTLDKMYAEASVTVLPSVDRSEAFGLVLLESMAQGTPVIASNLAGVNSVVTASVGQLVEPGNLASLEEALVRSLQKRLTKSEREKVRQYVKENYSDEVVQSKLVDELNSL